MCHVDVLSHVFVIAWEGGKEKLRENERMRE